MEDGQHIPGNRVLSPLFLFAPFNPPTAHPRRPLSSAVCPFIPPPPTSLPRAARAAHSFTTSSLKKRKISRPGRRGDDRTVSEATATAARKIGSAVLRHARPLRHAPSDRSLLVLPSTEGEDEEKEDTEGDDHGHDSPDDNDNDDSGSDDSDDNDDGNSSDANPSFSFSASSPAAFSSGPTTPTYSRAGSSPPSSSSPAPPDTAAPASQVRAGGGNSSITATLARGIRGLHGIHGGIHGIHGLQGIHSRSKVQKANTSSRRASRPRTDSSLPRGTHDPPLHPSSLGPKKKREQEQRPDRRRNPPQRPARSQSPLVPVAHRALLMGGAAGDHPTHRSSSPLKRPASSMDQTPAPSGAAATGANANKARAGSNKEANAKEDVDMITLPPTEEGVQADSHEDIQVDTQEGAARPASAKEKAASAATVAAASPPPIEEQIRIIEGLVKPFNSGELQEKTTAYLISRRWLAPAQALGSGDIALAAKTLPNGTLGPVDNSDIIDSVIKDIHGAPAVRLKAGISQEDFEYFPKQAWDLVVSWYGLADGQLPIVRTAHNTAPNSMLPNVLYELHPPVFTLHRLWSVLSGIPHDKEVPNINQPPPVVMCSSSCKVQDFLKRAKTLLHIPMDRSVRVWRVPRKLAAGNSTPSLRPVPAPAKPTSMLSLNTPPDSPRLDATAGTAPSPSNPQDSWAKLLLDVSDFTKLQSNSEREVLTQVKDCTNDSKYNGQSTLAFISLVVDQTIVLDENIERTFWVSTYSSNKKNKADKRHGGASSPVVATANSGAARISATAATSTAASSGRSSPSNAGPVTRGRAKQKSGRTLGCVGLSNLGNTCYMNSALQCVRSVKELTEYFLVHENQNEVNHSNPLGHGGNVANAYGYLLDEIYKTPVPMSITPRQFKATIGRYAPAFSGYSQQDSQEFLGFLLDGLQEDLSRIKKKPYIAKPDSTDEMINDPAAIRQMAEQVWDITKRRDDSVIADLFTGLYKSTLVCPVCQKVSITFDPFTNLTLPLPIRSFWSKTVQFVPLNDRPVCIDVELDKNSSIRALKEFVAVRVGIPVARLVCAEELRDGIVKVHEDMKPVSEEISNNDIIVVFEVEAAPTNCVVGQMPRRRFRSMLQIDDEPEQTPKWDSPLAERLLVPVLHRFDPTIQRPGYNKGGNMAGPPHFIVLAPDEARSEDTIRRKILEKVASFSTWSGFKGEDDSPADGDLVVASASDAGSAGDSKVVAKSIQGEDDMVDVVMNDKGDTSSQPPQPASKVLYKFNQRRPKWVTDPSIYPGGEMNSLFDLSYYDDRGNLIPVKWVPTRDDKVYPKLHSRVPQAPAAAADLDMDSPGNTWESAGNSGGSGSDNESSQEGSTVASDLTRMVDESDEEDSVLPAVRNLAHRHAAGKVGAGRRKAVKHHKAHSSKGFKRRQRHALALARHAEANADEDENENDLEAYSQGSSPHSAPAVAPADSGPLVRLGEGIMVDWHPDAWDMIYGKTSRDDEMRGEPTYLEPLPLVDDPELQERRRDRQRRRKQGLTLDECLDEFEREEILSENDTWYCPRCKKHQRASKKFDLWKTPDILVVHLKRFSSSGWRRDKLDTRVDFPVEGLDLTKRVLDRQTGKEEVYDLIAVDDHWGGLGGGHYTAFAKNFIDNQWYEYNAAYLLFYRRRSDVPLGGPRFQAIEEKFNLATADSDTDVSGSGEDQRLDTGSSSNGLSSASKGAVAGLRPRASPGSASGGTSSRGVGIKAGRTAAGRRVALDDDDDDDDDDLADEEADANDDDDYLPPYSERATNGSARQAGTTSILNFGETQPAEEEDEQVHKSIETEDGFHQGSGSNDGLDWMQPWSFGRAGGDGRSVRRNSPDSDVADVDELELGDADTAASTTAPYTELMSLVGDEAGDKEEGASSTRVSSRSPPPPPPDVTAQAAMEDIQQHVWARKQGAADQVHRVVLSEDEDVSSEKAVDIHLSD